MPQKAKWRIGGIVVLVVLLCLRGLASYTGIVGWGMGADDSGERISVNGYIAMALGILATPALGFGLMTLMYYSSRNGRD